MTCLVAVQLVRTLPLETHLGTDEDPVTWQVCGCIEIIRMVSLVPRPHPQLTYRESDKRAVLQNPRMMSLSPDYTFAWKVWSGDETIG